MDTRLEVLVCEDTPDDAFFLQKAFRDAEINATIHVVQNGSQAMEFLAGRNPCTVKRIPTRTQRRRRAQFKGFYGNLLETAIGVRQDS